MSGKIIGRPASPYTESDTHVANTLGDMFQYNILNEIVFKIIAEIPHTPPGTPLHKVCRRLWVLCSTTREGKSFIALDRVMRINHLLLNICTLVKIEAFQPNPQTREQINSIQIIPTFALFHQLSECYAWRAELSRSLVGIIAEQDPEIAKKIISKLTPGPLKGQLEILIATKVFPHSQKQAKQIADCAEDNFLGGLENNIIHPAKILTKFYPEWSLKWSSGCDSHYIHLEMIKKVSKVWERRDPDYMLSLTKHGEKRITSYTWRLRYLMIAVVRAVALGNFEHANTYLRRAINKASKTDIPDDYCFTTRDNLSQERIDVEKIYIIYFLSMLDVSEAKKLCQKISTNFDHKSLIDGVLNNELSMEEAVETTKGLHYKCRDWISGHKKPANIILGIIAACYKNRNPQLAKDVCLRFIERVIQSDFEYDCDYVLLLAILYDFSDTDLEGTLEIVEKISPSNVRARVLIDLSEYCSMNNQDFAQRLLSLAAKEVGNHDLIRQKVGYLLAKSQSRISPQDALKTILAYYQKFRLDTTAIS